MEVAVAIVDPLEAIQVDERARDRKLVAGRAGDLAMKLVQKVGLGPAAGQLVNASAGQQSAERFMILEAQRR